ncbi:hypothetical protein [Metamycoplasma buccale]|uniref:hypothetical protein n=1 Tax=Metamycoplasma buccale TaxID=55602 RepID=UPI00398F2BCC
MNLSDIKQIINSAILTIAGIIGFKSLDNSNDKLDESNILIEKSKNDDQTINITMGLVILSKVSAKSIVEAIYQNLTYLLSKNNLKLGELFIYIKGTN